MMQLAHITRHTNLAPVLECGSINLALESSQAITLLKISLWVWMKALPAALFVQQDSHWKIIMRKYVIRCVLVAIVTIPPAVFNAAANDGWNITANFTTHITINNGKWYQAAFGRLFICTSCVLAGYLIAWYVRIALMLLVSWQR